MENEEKFFSVAISYNNALGYVEYDGEKKEIKVTLGDDEGRKKAQEYLAKTHEINVPQETIHDFKQEVIDPKADVRSFQLVMTKIWEATGVYVDWSRPVDYVKEHPHY